MIGCWLITICLVVLLEALGPSLDEVRKTMLRPMVVAGGFGEQDSVMLDVPVNLRNW